MATPKPTRRPRKKKAPIASSMTKAPSSTPRGKKKTGRAGRVTQGY